MSGEPPPGMTQVRVTVPVAKSRSEIVPLSRFVTYKFFESRLT